MYFGTDNEAILKHFNTQKNGGKNNRPQVPHPHARYDKGKASGPQVLRVNLTGNN